MITDKEISNINSLPIRGIAASLGMDIDHYGRCICPFHEDHNESLVLYAENNSFYCFGCQAYGRNIDLVMRKLSKGFVDACSWISSNSNIILSEQERKNTSFRRAIRDGPKPMFDPGKYSRYFAKPTLNCNASIFLFKERQLNPKVVEWCRVSSWYDRNGTPWLQIPFFGIDGELTGVQWRNLSNNGPRFRYPAGSRCHLYNLPIVRYLEQGKPLYIAEGCSDCWSLLSSGYKAIAIPSATMLTQESIRQLSILHSRLSIEFHMFPDNDGPGERLYRKLGNLLPVVRHQLPEGCKDYSDYYLLNKKTIKP